MAQKGTRGTKIFAVAALLLFTAVACEHLKPPTRPPSAPVVPQRHIPWPSLADSPWPMYHGNPQSTGRSPYAGPGGPQLKWTLELPGGAGSVVIGPDSTLYFPVSYELVEKRQHAFLYASRLDGTIKWKFPLQQPPYPAGIDSQPLVGADGAIYIGAPNGNFYAVNPEGTLRWKYKADAGIYMPGINIGLDGALYFVADDKMLYAVNPDGTLRWRLSVQGGFKGTGSGIAFSTTGQTLYVPGESEFGSAEQTKFYAVNLDGGIEWEFLAGGEIHAVPMVDSDDNIYVAATSQGALHSWLYSLTPDGQIRWKIEFQGSAVNDPTIDGNGNIYVDMQTSLISIDYFGKVRWVVPVAGITTSLVCDSGNRIFGFAGGIFSIDPAGELLWKTEVPTLARVSPAIDAMGTLYIGTWLVGSSLDKRLYAVGQK